MTDVDALPAPVEAETKGVPVDLEDEEAGLRAGGRGERAGASKTQGGGDDEEDSGDEAAPDYRLIASLARKNNAGGDPSSGAVNAPLSIPKRGEKDFEPTGFVAQSAALEASRTAMFEVISTERRTGSKSVSVATWEPLLRRAIVHNAKGTVLNAMGVSHRVHVLEDGRDEDLAQLQSSTSAQSGTAKRAGVMKQDIFYPKTRVRLELFPEEALFLVERGALECRIRIDGKTADIVDGESDETEAEKDTRWIPMTVQQAYATMMDCDGNTRQRYQLYAYLKRLGYFVQRVGIVDELRHAAAEARRKKKRDAREDLDEEAQQNDEEEDEVDAKGILIDKKHPLRLVTIFDLLLYPFRRISQASFHGLQNISTWLYQVLLWLRNRVSNVTMMGRSRRSEISSDSNAHNVGRGLLGIGGRRWDSFDAVFDRLRIVPSGHDRPLHGSGPAKVARTEAPEICFYAWRPATHYKRTDPPLPEFRIAVMDAQRTSLLSGKGFKELYAQLPPLSSKVRRAVPAAGGDEGAEEEDAEEDEEDEEEKERAAQQKKRNDESYGRGAVKKMAAAAEAKRRRAAAEREGASVSAAVESSKRSDGIILAARDALRNRFLQLLRLLAAIFSLLPPGARPAAHSVPRRPGYNAAGGRRPGAGPRPPNVFPPLKSGRRNVIVAVNDCGTTSLLRFGESEFDRWKLAGTR